VGAKPTLVSLILDATAAGRAMLTAASAAAQKTLLSLTKSDVGLPNVDNTSDANKPVSTAQQTAIDAKIGGTLGATDNRIPRSDGAGGLTLQQSPISVDDNGAITTGGLTITPVNGAFTISQTVGIIISTSNAFIVRHGNNDYCGFRTGTGAISTISPAGFGAIALMGSSNNVGAYFAIPAAGTLAIRNAAHGDANLTAAAITASGLMCCGVYTFATVPSAASNTGKFLRISDRAQKHAYSDGTDWRFFGDDAIIS